MRRTVFSHSPTLCKLGRMAVVSAALGLFASVALVAQTPQSNATSLVTTRLTQPINENARVTLHGTVHPLANAANDRGAAPDGLQLERMHLVLKRSDAQESALKQLISDMHTSGTASYHKWLTPDQFGQQFGPSDQDIATVETWLQSKGFSVTSVNPGKLTMEISGNAGQLRSAFHTQIHKYMVNGETHYANSTDPQIPAALAPVVGGFVSLNNFRPRNFSHVLGKASYNPKTGKGIPQWTEPSGGPLGYDLVLSPADYAVQYDLQPLYTAGTNGTGQTVAIINDSNINIALVNQFRTLFGLSANPPQVIIDGNDPGVDGTNNPDGPNGDSGEAYLDVEWAGAVAPGATIDLVIGADTALESGLALAAEHAVYGNVAPIMSMSFGFGCEASSFGGNSQFFNTLWEQAAAQGITVMVSTGDAAAAGCDDDNTQAYAVNGVGVSGAASTPYNVAVGGTDFYYSSWNSGSSTTILNQIGTYWSTTPSNSPSVSILGYIPEQPWNNSQYGLNLFTSSGTTIAGGSGGASSAAICSTSYDPTTGACTGSLSGYPKPAWQAGFGNDNVRDLPDVSLFAANGFNNSYYPVCISDGDCQTPASGQPTQITGIGGTSASSPAFAGIMALVNQKYGRQGQADFVLYPLSKQFPTAFHDVANGNNSVPCNISTTSTGVPASLDCIAVSNPQTGQDNVNGTATEGQTGNTTSKTPDYNATAGYDLASGLGTIDANLLVTNWGNVKFATTTTTLTSSSASFTHGTAVTLSGSVTGTGTPTGSVALVTDSTTPLQQAQANFPLTNGSFSNSVSSLPGGTYNIWGQYSGDSANGASSSEKTSITVNPENSGVYLAVISPTGTVPSGTGSIDYGTQLTLSALAAPSSQLAALQKCETTSGATCPSFGVPTGTVAFTDGGTAINTAVINAEGDAEYNAPFGIGSHSVTASYSGDASYNKSSASAITFTVVKDTPQIAVGASNTTSSGQVIAGQATVFNILIQNNAQLSSVNSNTGQVFPVPIAPPTGTITVTGFPSGVPTSGTLSAAVDPTSRAVEAVATITAPANTPSGNYNVKISYPGDGNYNATSGSGTIQIVSTSGLSTTTTATASASSTSPTAAITVTGTVTGQSGHAAPTGGIIIYSSGNAFNQEIGLTASGSNATFAFTLNSQSLFQGANFVTLQYTGDSTYAPSATTLNNGSAISNPLSDFSIVPETTIVPVTAGAKATDIINATSVNSFSGAVTFTCTSSSGITCTVTSSATLSPGSSSSASSNSVPLTLTISAGSSAANGPYNVLVTGTDSTGHFIHTLTIQAVVSGASTGPSFTLTPSPATIAAITAGGSGTSSITVAPTNGFTGSVALACSVSGGPSGATDPTCSLSANSVDITGATGLPSTLTVTTTATTTAGSYTVTVTGTSGGLTESTQVGVTVNAPANANFTLSSSSATAISSPGGSTTSTITVNPVNGFTGTVALTCKVTTSPSGAVNTPGCSLSPASTSTTSTLTVTTTAATSSALDSPLNKLFAVGGGLAVAGLLFFGIPARRRSWSTILGVLVFAAIVGLGIGCGSSSGNSGGTTGGTTTGAYTITVTGTSGSLPAQTTTVNVTVN
jgi:trimeric autotransporter adhesin